MRLEAWLSVSRHDLDAAQSWFGRHGGAAVFFCRLVPAIRSLISIPAGIARMTISLFLIYTALGTTLWSAFLALLGYVLGSNFRQIGDYLDPVSWFVVAAIVVIYLVRIIRHKGEEPA
jgi:membrane protein DedA with SNARE-associated domain